MKATQILGYLLIALFFAAMLWRAKRAGALKAALTGAIYGLATGGLFYLAVWLISGGAA